MSRICVVGSANMDLTVHVTSLPKPGETVLGGEFRTSVGGKGLNQAVAAGRLGGQPHFVGCVGKDAHGEHLRSYLQESSVAVGFVDTDDHHPTGVALITVDGQGENTISVASGANLQVTRTQVREALAVIQPDITLCQLEIPLDSVLAASEAGGVFILNPAPACSLADELLARCDLITPNETETEVLTGISVRTDDDCRRAAQSLRARGVKAVVITRGEQGVFYQDATSEHMVRAESVATTDTTGAGDAFNGALAVFFELGIEAALKRAVRYATVTTTRVGAADAMPSLSEFEALGLPSE